ncbi:MAG: hypothetical protein VB078_08895 [Clostridiaceae bacterium]|nr:hypothetical protein [Clostridiaceae bacterium]
MKKLISSTAALSICLCFMLSGCSDSGESAKSSVPPKETSVNDVIEGQLNQQPEATDDKEAEKLPETEPQDADKADGAPDVDLTQMSATMIYAEVYNMLVSPDEYIGKTIRMQGQYYASYDETTKRYYHFVIISDATACCSQGMEFTLNGDYTYPDDYPANDTVIEVTGVFGLYEELGATYCHLTADGITVIE